MSACSPGGVSPTREPSSAGARTDSSPGAQGTIAESSSSSCVIGTRI